MANVERDGDDGGRLSLVSASATTPAFAATPGTSSTTRNASTSGCGNIIENISGNSNSSEGGIKTKTASKKRRITIVAIGIVAAVIYSLVLLGAGYRIGRSNCRSTCHSNTKSSNSNSTEDNPSSFNVNTTNCFRPNTEASPGTGNSDSSGSSGSSSTDGFPMDSDRVNDFESCASNDDVQHELRLAVQMYATQYIDEFGDYIQRGGQNTMVVDDFEMVHTEAEAVAAPPGTVRRRQLGVSEKATANAPKARVSEARRAAASQSALDNSDNNTDNLVENRRVQIADMVQTAGVSGNNDHLVYMAYDDEVLVIQSATSTIAHRVAVPKRYRDSSVKGLLLVPTMNGENDHRLVVIVQEVDFDFGVDGSGVDAYTSSVFNTTLLVYRIDDMTVERQESLPGMYTHAHAVGSNVHVATSTHVELFRITGYLTPAHVQGVFFPDHASSATSLFLNETQYRDLAHQVLQDRLDAFLAELASQVDCTGFVPTFHLAGRQNVSNLGTRAPSTMVHVVSLSISSSSPPFFTNSTSWIMSDGVSSDWVVSSDGTRLVLACDVWSGSQYTNASQPQSWLVSLALTETSVQFTSAGLIPGSVSSAQSAIALVQKNETDYLYAVTTRFEGPNYNVDNPVPTQVQVTILVMTSHTDSLMPIVSELSGLVTDDNNSTLVSIESTLFEKDHVLVAVRLSTGTCVLYRIDTLDPRNPLLVFDFVVPLSAIVLYPLSSGLILGIDVESIPDDQEQLQLVLLNTTFDSRQRLVASYQYEFHRSKSDTSSNSSTLTTSAEISSEVAYDKRSVLYHADSNVLIVPLRVDEYRLEPCPWWGSQSNASNDFPDDTCRTDSSVLFDGFWLFKITANSSISKHLEIDHALTSLLQPGCTNDGFISSRSLVFDGDVMTMKKNAVLTHDLLTKAEAAPALVLSVDCD